LFGTLSQFARTGIRRFCVILLVAITAGTSLLTLHAPAFPQGPIVTIGPSAEIVPPSPNYHFPDGQAYVYGVEWHFFNAGTATVKIENAGSDRKVSAIADS